MAAIVGNAKSISTAGYWLTTGLGDAQSVCTRGYWISRAWRTTRTLTPGVPLENAGVTGDEIRIVVAGTAGDVMQYIELNYET